MEHTTNPEAPATESRRRRFPRKTAVVVTALGIALVAGVAYALYLLSAGVSGSVTTDTASYTWDNVNITATGTMASTGCKAQVVGTGNGNSLKVTVEGYPSDTCTVTAPVKMAGNSEPFQVTGIQLTGIPATWSAAVDPASCGKTVNTTDAFVTFTVTVGTSGTGTIGGGLTLSPTSQTGGTVTTCTKTGS